MLFVHCGCMMPLMHSHLQTARAWVISTMLVAKIALVDKIKSVALTVIGFFPGNLRFISEAGMTPGPNKPTEV